MLLPIKREILSSNKKTNIKENAYLHNLTKVYTLHQIVDVVVKVVVREDQQRPGDVPSLCQADD